VSRIERSAILAREEKATINTLQHVGVTPVASLTACNYQWGRRCSTVLVIQLTASIKASMSDIKLEDEQHSL